MRLVSAGVSQGLAQEIALDGLEIDAAFRQHETRRKRTTAFALRRRPHRRRQGQEMLGDVVFADLPDVGQAVSEGAPCATLESVKAASDVLCPVDGEVLEINEALEDSPELINDDPLDEGWILKIRMEGQPAEWMSPDEYGRMLESTD